MALVNIDSVLRNLLQKLENSRQFSDVVEVSFDEEKYSSSI
jgi:hypothetical protein